jgi:hypothetical protein
MYINTTRIPLAPVWQALRLWQENSWSSEQDMHAAHKQASQCTTHRSQMDWRLKIDAPRPCTAPAGITSRTRRTTWARFIRSICADVDPVCAVATWSVILSCYFGLVASVAAMPPVLLTRDTTTAADLTGTPLLETQRMQDCQLRLEGKPGNYRLAYSGGTIPVPTKAVKTIQDGYWVEMAVKGKINGLSVRMLSIPYFEKSLTMADIFGLDGRKSRFGAPETYYYIVFGDHESVVEPQLRKLWPEGVMLNHRSHPNPNPGTLQYLADKRITDPVGGEFGIIPLQSKMTTTTVNYACIIRRDTR